MKVMKFGGSSIGNAERIRSVLAVVAAECEKQRVCLVFSAMKGVTDLLLSAADAASAGDDDYLRIASGIEAQHLQTAADLLPVADGETGTRATTNADLLEALRGECHDLAELLHGVRLVRECTPRTRDLIVGYGERLSCRVIAAALSATGLPARYVDAREIIRTDDTHGSASVAFRDTYALVKQSLGSVSEIPVVTGFIAATADGVSTTLGRNGSDYTASLLGAGLGADAIEIWTDVDGVYSADPRHVPDAFVLPEISYREAMELSYFGAEVIHPYTMVPAVDRSIPLWIKNTLRPSQPGTLIAENSARAELITGIASVEGVALINVEGGGMVGYPGIAGRIFTALANARINIIMISQASSEHSICFVVRDAASGKATILVAGSA